jgi:nickel transport system permease protein
MISFIIKRILLLIPILFVVSIFVFCILRIGNNDPAMSYLRLSNIPPTDEALKEARKELNLDKPIVDQYIEWFAKAIRLDFGRSYVTKRIVIDDILYYLPATLQLTFVSLLLTILISIPFGVFSARFPNSAIDNIGRGISFFGVSMPNFFLGFLMVYFFSVTLHLLPPMGKGGIRHFILPSITLSMMSIAILIRFVRTNMIEEMNHRYILYAKARGVTERRITWMHQFKSSLIPVITVLGMHLGELLGGAVVVETIFAWPGVGRYAVSAIYNRDFPVIECFLLIMTIIFVLCNLLVDILYAWIDPRVRYSTGVIK